MSIGIIYNNGWKSNDFRFLSFQIFRQENLYGIEVGLAGILIGLGFMKE